MTARNTSDEVRTLSCPTWQQFSFIIDIKKVHFGLFSDSVYEKIILLCKIGPKWILLSFEVICYLILKIHHTNVQSSCISLHFYQKWRIFIPHSFKHKLSNNIFNLGHFYKDKIKSQNCLICISPMNKDVIIKQILNIFQSF